MKIKVYQEIARILESRQQCKEKDVVAHGYQNPRYEGESDLAGLTVVAKRRCVLKEVID